MQESFKRCCLRLNTAVGPATLIGAPVHVISDVRDTCPEIQTFLQFSTIIVPLSTFLDPRHVIYFYPTMPRAAVTDKVCTSNIRVLNLLSRFSPAILVQPALTVPLAILVLRLSLSRLVTPVRHIPSFKRCRMRSTD